MQQGDFGPYCPLKAQLKSGLIWELPDDGHCLQGVISYVTNFLKSLPLSFTLSLFCSSMAFSHYSSNSQWSHSTVYFLVHAFTGLVEASGIISSHS